MKRKNLTRNALFTSIISLLLCVSMLVGTTFAWFTDEVVTGMNTIAAGNLDIELKANGENVNSGTVLFDDVEKWEPGVVVYENIQVANVGTLALKYQMTLNFRDVNDLNGHKLSEVVKVAVIDKVDGATREKVLADAKAAAQDLTNFYLTGELEAGETTTEQAIVVFWAPNDNATDNLYNANNGQVTSDGNPLSIEFGINLQATQKMSEEDSFGSDYDKFATILPKAKVTNIGAQPIEATVNAWGNGAAVENFDAPFVLQFEPNETLEQANSSAYKYWHADFVAKADKDIAAGSVALAGYYKVFCDSANSGNWVALTADEIIPAGTEIRLVETMGGGAIKVTYKDICQYGNDGTGFLCTAIDMTGENVGTTITVELRMYANESDPTDSSYNGGTETGESYLIGTYTYTFGGKQVATAEELATAIEDGGIVVLTDDIAVTDEINITEDVAITLNGYTLDASGNASRPFTVADGASLTINAGDQEVECGAYGLVNMTEGTLTINGGTFTQENGNNGSFVRVSGDENMVINLNNVTYKAGTTDSGVIRTSGSNVTVNVVGGTYEAGMGFLLENGSITGASITATNTANMWPAVYADGNVTVSGCTIKSACHAVAVGGGNTVKVENCDVQVADGKLAFQVFSSGGTINVVNCTYNGSYGTTGKINTGCPDAVIVIDGVEVYRKSAA